MQSYTKEQIATFRRENLKSIADMNGGNLYLVDKLGRSASQISQWIGRRSHNLVKSKALSSKLAREFERKLNLPPGSLDLPKNDASDNYSIKIESIENGAVPATEADSLLITPQAAEYFDRNYQNRIIAICTDPGMQPKINVGAIMICKKVDSFEGDGFYIIAVDGHHYTRHVSKIPGEDSCIIKALDDMISDRKASIDAMRFLAKVDKIFNRGPI